MCCGKKMTTWVPSGWDYKEITVKCGNTSPTGMPFLCEECEEKHANTNWYHEAEMNGERIDPLD
jgi:hypothetical protein